MSTRSKNYRSKSQPLLPLSRSFLLLIHFPVVPFLLPRPPNHDPASSSPLQHPPSPNQNTPLQSPCSVIPPNQIVRSVMFSAASNRSFSDAAPCRSRLHLARASSNKEIQQGGYGNGERRRGHQRGMMVRGGGAYGGAWGTPPPMYDDVPPTMYVRGPPTYPPQQYRGGGRGGHGGIYGGGRYGGGGYGGGYDEEDYGYRGGQGQMLRPTPNPKFSGFEIGSNNQTDNGGNQVRLRFDLSKLKDIPERAGGVKIGTGQYARENGNMVDFSEYQDPVPAPPPPPPPQAQ